MHSSFEDPGKGHLPELDYNDEMNAGSRPWYNNVPPFYFKGLTLPDGDSNSVQLMFRDSPSNGPPNASGLAKLTHIDFSETFQLDVAAATLDDPNRPIGSASNKSVYTRVSTAQWSFNINGDVKANDPNWVKQVAAVIAPYMWTAVTDGSRIPSPAAPVKDANNIDNNVERFEPSAN